MKRVYGYAGEWTTNMNLPFLHNDQVDENVVRALRVLGIEGESEPGLNLILIIKGDVQAATLSPCTDC